MDMENVQMLWLDTLVLVKMVLLERPVILVRVCIFISINNLGIHVAVTQDWKEMTESNLGY